MAEGDHPWIVAVHAVAPLSWTEHEFASAEELHRQALKIVLSEKIADEKSFERPPMFLHLLKAPGLRVLLIIMHHWYVVQIHYLQSSR